MRTSNACNLHLGMSEDEFKSTDQNKICEIYDSWLQGRINREEYQLFILNYIGFYIKKEVHKAPNFDAARSEEDMTSDVIVKVLEKLPKYDPHTGVYPATFFLQDIKHEIVDYTKGGKTTNHYFQQAGVLLKAAKALGFKGLTDPGIEPQKLALITKIPLTTVIKTIESESYTKCSFEKFNGNVDSYSTGPDEVTFEKMRNEILYAELKKLTPFQRFLVSKMCMDDNMSPNVVQRYIRAHPDMFPDIRDISAREIQKIYNKALRSIQSSKAFQQYTDNVQTAEQVDMFVAQATDEDFANLELLELVIE